MIQVFSQLNPASSQAQGALPAGPVWQRRDSLAPHGCVELHRAVNWGPGPRARVPSTLYQLIPILSELSWPNPGTLRMGSGCSPGPANPNWGRGKDTQGQSWQELAPSHLLRLTPRTYFPSLAAPGPLHPQSCWWEMARTSPPALADPLCHCSMGLFPLCAT